MVLGTNYSQTLQVCENIRFPLILLEKERMQNEKRSLITNEEIISLRYRKKERKNNQAILQSLSPSLSPESIIAYLTFCGNEPAERRTN